MTCSEIQAQLSFYLYGELDFAEEEALETHLNDCPMCQLAWSREKRWHSAVNESELPVPDRLLTSSRSQLQQAVRRTAQPKARSWHIPEWLHVNFTHLSGRVAYASFFIFCGILVAHLGNRFFRWNPASLSSDSGIRMSILDSPSTRVRDIHPETGGRVRIIVDRLQEQELIGSADDSDIRSMLLSAARNSTDPGLRIDSVDILRQRHSSDIRDVLLSVTRHDENAAVRLRALDSLRAFPSDPAARETMLYVLQHDADPSVRAEAINALLPLDQQIVVGPELIRTLRGITVSEQADDYVRERCMAALRAAGSPDIY